MQRFLNLPPSRLAQPAALSVLEVLVSLTLLASLTVLTAGAVTTLASWRGLSAIQQLAADLDEARALALSGQQEAWLAFANSGSDAFRAYVRCSLRHDPDGAWRLQPVGDWNRLPPGHVFALATPASPEAGRNLLTDPTALKSAQLGGTRVQLPCIGFGSLGEILSPLQGRPLLAITEGDVVNGHPRPRHGPGPEACRWLSLQRYTGNALIQP